MLEKRASARIDRVVERFEDLEPSMGRQRLAAVKMRVAATDPVLLDPTRFAYLRVRAVSDGEIWGPNDNGDFFPSEHLEARHSSFVYCPVYLDHRNWDAREAVGIIVASVHHPPPQPGGWVEIILAIDRKIAAGVKMAHLPGSPDLLTAIREGRVTDTSMGCFVEYSLCSICGNRAVETYEYCPHIANSKGLPVRTAAGEKVAYEVNHNPFFFEDSIICTTIAQGGGGADQQAKILSEVVAASGHSDWRRLLIDRRALLARAGKESGMSVPVTAAGASGLAVGPEGKVTFEPVNPDYPIGSPPDPDKDTYEESKGRSAPVPAPSNAPADNLSLRGDPKDHPHTARKTGANADPDSVIGGEPEEVTEAKEKDDEKKKDAVEEHKEKAGGDDDGDKSPPKSDDADEEKDAPKEARRASIGTRLAHSIANLIGWKAKVREGEGLLAMQDHITDLTIGHKALVARAVNRSSPMQRAAAVKEADAVARKIRRSLAIVARAVTDPVYASWLDKKVAAAGGNPQELVDRGDYGDDPDRSTYDQAKGSSVPARAPGSQRPENVSMKDGRDHGQAGAVALAGRGWVRARNGGFVNVAQRRAFSPAQVNGAVDRVLAAMAAGDSYEVAERKALASLTGGRRAMVNVQPRRATPAGRSVVRSASGSNPSQQRTASEPFQSSGKWPLMAGDIFVDDAGEKYEKGGPEDAEWVIPGSGTEAFPDGSEFTWDPFVGEATVVDINGAHHRLRRASRRTAQYDPNAVAYIIDVEDGGGRFMAACPACAKEQIDAPFDGDGERPVQWSDLYPMFGWEKAPAFEAANGVCDFCSEPFPPSGGGDVEKFASRRTADSRQSRFSPGDRVSLMSDGMSDAEKTEMEDDWGGIGPWTVVEAIWSDSDGTWFYTVDGTPGEFREDELVKASSPRTAKTWQPGDKVVWKGQGGEEPATVVETEEQSDGGVSVKIRFGDGEEVWSSDDEFHTASRKTVAFDPPFAVEQKFKVDDLVEWRDGRQTLYGHVLEFDSSTGKYLVWDPMDGKRGSEVEISGDELSRSLVTKREYDQAMNREWDNSNF